MFVFQLTRSPAIDINECANGDEGEVILLVIIVSVGSIVYTRSLII